jgi:hypothetical protein
MECVRLRAMKTLRFAVLLAAVALGAHAATLEPVKDSTQATVLQSQAGKVVELHLKSGEKIGGKVAFVGATVVHLTSLTGMEMFEATVTIADISAVVVRTAK